MSAPRRVVQRRESGASLVELALVAPVLILFFLGLLEYGLLFRDTLTANDATSDAARIGAVVGPDTTSDGRTADFEIVRTLREGVSALDDGQVEAIVVFKASSTDDAPEDQVPTPCRNGTSLAGICNAYDPTEAFAAIEDGDVDFFRCLGDGDPACGWDPADRRNGPTATDIETVGVYLRIHRDSITKLFQADYTITRASLGRLEPGLTE